MANILITGGNRGIGLALTQRYLAGGHQVTVLCRETSPDLAATAARVEAGVDLTDEHLDLVARLGAKRLDIVIHCAGLLIEDRLSDFEADALRRQLEINAIVPLRLTRALLPLLHEGAKIALITSRMGSIADNSSGGYYGYRMSKAALNMVGQSLAVDLKPQGIAVALLHPGYVRTRMTGGQGLIDPAQSAEGLMAQIEALTLETSGGFWHMNGERLPW